MPLFTCDELTPSLCDLRVTNGSLAVRGLEVQFTHYHAVNPDRSKLPIVMVHGGPGWSHHYMLPLKQQACRGRDVFFYDQAGAGTAFAALVARGCVRAMRQLAQAIEYGRGECDSVPVGCGTRLGEGGVS